jgi:hypothetical protein
MQIGLARLQIEGLH